MTDPDMDRTVAIDRTGDAMACLQRLSAWSLLAVVIWAMIGQDATQSIRPSKTAPVVELTVNVNRADEREFRLLPTIGPKLAQRIVLDRERNGPFADVDSMVRVDGIGEKTLDIISNYCCILEPTTETSWTTSNHSIRRLPIGSKEHRIASR